MRQRTAVGYGIRRQAGFAEGRAVAGLVVLALVGWLGGGCKCAESESSPAGSASAEGLDPKLANEVLARVGDLSITVGDYAAALQSMDRFERVRYQTAERREELLNDMIEVELLAAEARRRGLDRDPAVRDRIRQAMREQLLEDLREDLPGPEDIPDAEVRKYYEKHQADFIAPERRRVSAIHFESEAAARNVLDEAREATPEQWGKLVQQHGSGQKPQEGSAPELAGDLGFIVDPNSPSEYASPVPEALREAAFKIPKQGDVYPDVVAADGQYFVLRLTSRTPAGQRQFGEAERSVRVTIARQRFREAETALEQELRKKYPVEVDKEALDRLQISPGE